MKKNKICTRDERRERIEQKIDDEVISKVSFAVNGRWSKVDKAILNNERAKNKKIYDLYHIGIRLRHINTLIIEDEKIYEGYKLLKEYVEGAWLHECNMSRMKHRKNCYEESIYFLNYGYQMGIRAERERRKEAKEKAAKRGNAGRQNETSNS